eukprot:SAG31_NODE_105_length_25008_cov_17.439399_19_plen_182_part_00
MQAQKRVRMRRAAAAGLMAVRRVRVHTAVLLLASLSTCCSAWYCKFDESILNLSPGSWHLSSSTAGPPLRCPSDVHPWAGPAGLWRQSLRWHFPSSTGWDGAVVKEESRRGMPDNLHFESTPGHRLRQAIRADVSLCVRLKWQAAGGSTCVPRGGERGRRGRPRRRTQSWHGSSGCCALSP